MVDGFLKEVQNRMCASGIQLDLVPQLSINIIFYVEQILLIYVSPYKFIDESAVQFVIGLLGGSP